MDEKTGDGVSRRDLLKKATLGALAFSAGPAFFTPGRAQAYAAAGDGPSYIGPLAAADGPAVWDLDRAYRDATATRGRVSLNGLWRWQPAGPDAGAPPGGSWGYFKVPGSWPGITDYMHKDCQTVFAHPDWKDVSVGALKAAWYEREFTVPAEWTGRRISLSVEYLNSFAAVYVDGQKVDEMHFPAGELDLTAVCRPGAKHRLSMLVVAMPLRGVMLSYSDSASAREVRGSVARRGLCGDVYLVGTPPGARIDDVKVSTSVREWQATFAAALAGLAPEAAYRLQARVSDQGRDVAAFASAPFRAGDLEDGRISFRREWHPDKLWDADTPQNQYDLQLSLTDAGGKVLDAALPVRFGFREFWIDGRDFYLNGTRIYLSCVPLNNAQLGAAWADYAAARETMERLQGWGVNFVYTHNYGCEPGAHLSFAEILRAADDTGMLVSFSQPHFGQYDWQAADADQANGYARHAEFYVRAAQNHPSVVAYAMSHNATGYSEDMNPAMIDGLQASRDQWSANNARRALRAQAIVERLDPGRVIYHHAGGNIGSMHTSNFYTNFVAPQEMSDWLEHWASEGVKPFFLCEFGVPLSWDWTMYRGWYDGKRTFGSATVPWEFCLAEWNSEFLGDSAFQISEMEKANLRWEARQFAEGRLWHRWDYPNRVSSNVFPEREPVYAKYFDDTWRALRTWGVSAFCPWDHNQFWRVREGVDRGRVDLPVDWEKLQRPGLSADYIDERYEAMETAFNRGDWEPTGGGQAMVGNNAPLLAYLAGRPDAFTSRDHNFHPGETVEKMLVVINSSRSAAGADCRWRLALPQPVAGAADLKVEPGDQARRPLTFELPAALAPGTYELTARVSLAGGDVREDALAVHVMARPPAVAARARIALFDPRGETGRLLNAMGVRPEPVGAAADLSAYDVLVVGKGALSVEGAAPDAARVRDGLRVVVFEQTAPALERRLGFRVTERGLRWVFERVPGHPLLAGVSEENLRDWRGKATLTPPQLDYELSPKFNGAPTVEWCGIPVTRLWRCGNRGNVASVLIEKPVRGDFLPVLDGGFSLQYSPLLEYREGKGMMLFCQLDVTGRTESDPAADVLARNVMRYACEWQPSPRRQPVYAGEAAGKAHLEAAGLSLRDYADGGLRAGDVLVAGPGAGEQLAPHAAAIAEFLAAGGRVLAVGLEGSEASAFLPLEVRTEKAEHIAAYFDRPGAGSVLAGVGPADVHCRDPRELPLVRAGAQALGDGVLAQGPAVVFCQLVPWQFAPDRQSVKRTFRRSSYLLTRLLSNLGASGRTPLLERLSASVQAGAEERRWLDGLYLDEPQEWDDPYRFFRW